MNKKGFTLVELLAVVVIVGVISVIAITSVSKYLSSSRKEKFSQSKKNVAMATELYIQANRDFAPKAVGESTIIPLSTLKNKNYIKEDLTNEAGEDCMEKSFVRVYKLSIEEYSYSTYLYCGKDTVPTELEVPEPTVFDFRFTGGSKNASGQYSSVKDGKFSFKMKGSSTDSTIGIYSYSYSIFIKKAVDSYVEAYNSGSIKGNFQPAISVEDISLADYIDVSGVTDIRVDVTVINEQGGRFDYSTDKNNKNGSFADTNGPLCGPIEGNAKNSSDWINKETYGANGGILTNQLRSYPGRISVGCDDSNGSGCKRNSFSKTWPNDSMSDSGQVNYKYGAIWSYIEIEDNAKRANKTKCLVHVNVDLKSPTLEISVYKAKEDGTAGKKVYSTTVQDGQSITADPVVGTISQDLYQDLITNGNEKWMNKDNYPYGVIIKVSATDNLGLKNWKFELNNSNVPTGSDEVTIKGANVGIDNSKNEGNFVTDGNFSFDENIINSIPQSVDDLPMVEKYNTSERVPDLVIKNDGMRYGKLTVCDYADNCSTIHLFANLSLTTPKQPSVIYYKNDSSEAYTPATIANYKNKNNWSNEYIKVVPSISGTGAAGVDYFEYTYKKQTGKNDSTYSWSDPVTGTILPSNDQTGFLIKDQGTHVFQIRTCDRAGNCSDYTTESYIKIDTIKPLCDLKKKYEELKNGSYTSITLPSSGWLKNGQRVKLSHTCSEDNDSLSSGCNNDSDYNKQSFMYDFDINASKAGANGYAGHIQSGDSSIGGHVIDYAGNVSEECPTVSVKIDTIPPLCSSAISWPKGDPINPSDSSKLETGWLGMSGTVKKTAVVSNACDDSKLSNGSAAPVSSGCDNSNENNKAKHTYDTEMKITNAGALGSGKGGSVLDVAGNETNCPADRTVQIDYTAPVCSNKIEYGIGEDASTFAIDNTIADNLNDGWLGLASDTSDTSKKMAKVSQVCKDSKGTINSGCFGNMLSKVYAESMNSNKVGAAGVGVETVVKDKAGNEGKCSPDQSVKIDYDRPVCDVLASSDGTYQVDGTTYNWKHDTYNGEWLGQNAKVTIKETCTSSESGTDKSSGCSTNRSKVYQGEMNITNATAGNVGENTYVYDKAQNRSSSPCSKKTIKIDTSSPVCTDTSTYNGSNYDGRWVKGDKPVVVSSVCSQDKLADGSIGSGCKSTATVSHEHKANNNDILNTTGGASSDGNSAIIYDNVGNKTVCGKVTIKIDNQSPECGLSSTIKGTSTVYSGAWTNKQVLVSAVCVDGEGSGCDGTKPSYTYSANNSVFSTDVAGAAGVGNTAQVKDKVGNVTNCPNNMKVRIDTENPTCTIVERPSNTAAYPPQYLKTQCSDGNGSGCQEPITDTLEFDTFGELKNQTYSHTYTDKVGNRGTCTTTYNVINVNQEFDNVSCTISVSYTKDKSTSNKSVITVRKPSAITVVSYNNRGINKATATEADKAITCGTKYTASIVVRDATGTQQTVNCSNSVTTISCCDSNHLVWKDGDKKGNKTCSASCLSGTYNISKFSTLNGKYCNETKASGGSNCETPCTVYLCRKDFDHGSNYTKWTRWFSWTWFLDSVNINSTDDNKRLIGYGIGQNSTVYVTGSVYRNGYTNPHWKIKAKSCAGDTNKTNPHNAQCSNGQCPGWDVRCWGVASGSSASIYSGCISTTRMASGSDCAATCG